MGPARSHCATLLLRTACGNLTYLCRAHSTVDAQTQLSAAVEKERSATEKALTHQSRVTHLEKQIASLRQDNSRLTASLELERAKAETLEDGQQRCLSL